MKVLAPEKECAICGDPFAPDSYLRRLCPECRDDGYRKAVPERGMRTLVGRIPVPEALRK